MSHLTDDQTGLPPGRYGSPRKLPRWAAALLIAVGVIALLPVAVSIVQRARDDAHATVTDFTVETATRVSATVDITKPIGRTATCTLRARNFYSDAVGGAVLVVRGRISQQVVTKSFPTSDKAVIVEVTGCVTSAGS